jgi:hypothetical protein
MSCSAVIFSNGNLSVGFNEAFSSSCEMAPTSNPFSEQASARVLLPLQQKSRSYFSSTGTVQMIIGYNACQCLFSYVCHNYIFYKVAVVKNGKL